MREQPCNSNDVQMKCKYNNKECLWTNELIIVNCVKSQKRPRAHRLLYAVRNGETYFLRYPPYEPEVETELQPDVCLPKAQAIRGVTFPQTA